jgi:hypothetical protein
MKTKKVAYLTGSLVLLTLFILGIVVEKYLIVFASPLMIGICYFLIRDILKTRGVDPQLLEEHERNKFNSITRSKLPILVSIPIILPLIFIFSQVFAHNVWFVPIWFLSSSLVFIIIDTVIYIYYFKYLIKKREAKT